LLEALPQSQNGELVFWNTHDQHGLSVGLGGAR
jgi:hypothetical protein